MIYPYPGGRREEEGTDFLYAKRQSDVIISTPPPADNVKFVLLYPFFAYVNKINFYNVKRRWLPPERKKRRRIDA
jgi:hypothetical protein